MTHTAQSIEELFTRIASIRTSLKIQGDGGYWTGGRCEYGAAHNLQEDCQTLAKFFTKTSELKNSKRKLTSFENKEEFEALKQDLISQCNASIAGLQVKTRDSSSVGGICLVWEDYFSHLKSILDDAREGIETLKKSIERTSYDVAKKLKRLQIEERGLKKSIEENLRRAKDEKDPDKKKKLLILVDDDKKKLAGNLEEQKKINIGDNINIDDYIKNILEKLEQKLNPNRSSRTPNNSNPTENPEPTNNSSTPLNPFQPTSNPNQNFLQSNQPLIILGAIAALLILYFYYSQEEEPNYYDF